jgi:phage protein D
MIPFSPHAIVRVGESSFDSWNDKDWFKSVEVTLSTGQSSEAAWRFHDPDGKLLERWIVGDGVAALEASLSLGFAAELGKPIFEGLLASAEWSEEETTLRFYDRGYLMRQIKQTEYHRGLDDIGIIAKLAGQHKLQFEGPSPAIKLDKHKSVIQDAQTDWEHAEERAQDAGLVLFVRGSTLYAKEAARVGAPVVSVTYGEDFHLLGGASFRYRAPENQEGRPAKVEVRGRGRGGRRLSGNSDIHARGTERVEIKRDLAIKTKRHANRRAQAQKDLQREHAFTGTITLIPQFKRTCPDIRDTLEILQIGKLFSGLYIAESVNHSFAPGELETSIDVYRDIKTS